MPGTRNMARCISFMGAVSWPRGYAVWLTDIFSIPDYSGFYDLKGIAQKLKGFYNKKENPLKVTVRKTGKEWILLCDIQ